MSWIHSSTLITFYLVVIVELVIFIFYFLRHYFSEQKQVGEGRALDNSILSI